MGIGGIGVLRFFYFYLWWPFCLLERNDLNCFVGSHLGNIPVKSVLLWHEGLRGDSI